MIITSEKHGVSRQDRDNLVGHLLKDDSEILKVEIGNSLAADLRGVVEDMRLLRDASCARFSLHHLSVDPTLDHPPHVIIDAAHKLRLELDPKATRPYAIVVHCKPRAGSETGNLHAHLVLGHVDHRGRALKDSWLKIRTERLARELEFELGEPPTLGRHHRTVVKHLKRARPEVAEWLVAAFGENPPKPRSAVSSRTRRRALRRGVDLPAAKAAVRNAWASAGSVEEFLAALAQEKLSVVRGEIPGVWIVRAENSTTIGALDRLLRIGRIKLNRIMEVSFSRAAPRLAPHINTELPELQPHGPPVPSRPAHQEIGVCGGILPDDENLDDESVEDAVLAVQFQP